MKGGTCLKYDNLTYQEFIDNKKEIESVKIMKTEYDKLIVVFFVSIFFLLVKGGVVIDIFLYGLWYFYAREKTKEYQESAVITMINWNPQLMKNIIINDRIEKNPNEISMEDFVSEFEFVTKALKKYLARGYITNIDYSYMLTPYSKMQQSALELLKEAEGKPNDTVKQIKISVTSEFKLRISSLYVNDGAAFRKYLEQIRKVETNE